MAQANTLPSLPPISQLNTLPKDDFFKAVNTLFETAPPLASALLLERPFTSYEQLIDKAEAIIRSLSFDEKLQVINAHPRIGVNPATAQISPLSYREQGLDKEKEVRDAKEREEIQRVYAELAALNQQYEDKFGFKFVVFVAGRPKAALIPVLRERLQRSRDDELALGLSEMMAIARDRLKKLAPSVSPKM